MDIIRISVLCGCGWGLYGVSADEAPAACPDCGYEWVESLWDVEDESDDEGSDDEPDWQDIAEDRAEAAEWRAERSERYFAGVDLPDARW